MKITVQETVKATTNGKLYNIQTADKRNSRGSVMYVHNDWENSVLRIIEKNRTMEWIHIRVESSLGWVENIASSIMVFL